MTRRLAVVQGMHRGRIGKVSWLAWRRSASSLITLALGVSLLGTCPCALASPEACPAMPDRAGRPASCCERPSPATGYDTARCCEGLAMGDARAVAPTLGVCGPSSILHLDSAPPAPAFVVSESFSGRRLPPPVRLGGPPVLRI